MMEPRTSLDIIDEYAHKFLLELDVEYMKRFSADCTCINLKEARVVLKLKPTRKPLYGHH